MISILPDVVTVTEIRFPTILEMLHHLQFVPSIIFEKKNNLANKCL